MTRCKHPAWKTVGMDYIPPADRVWTKRFNAVARMALLGATTITQQCKMCGRIDTETIEGRVTGVEISSATP